MAVRVIFLNEQRPDAVFVQVKRDTPVSVYFKEDLRFHQVKQLPYVVSYISYIVHRSFYFSRLLQNADFIPIRAEYVLSGLKE